MNNKIQSIKNKNYPLPYEVWEFLNELENTPPLSTKDLIKLSIQQFISKIHNDRQSGILSLVPNRQEYSSMFMDLGRGTGKSTAIKELLDPTKHDLIISQAKKEFFDPYGIFNNGVILHSVENAMYCPIQFDTVYIEHPDFTPELVWRLCNAKHYIFLNWSK